MVREEAIVADGFWSGFVRTPPHSSSGWHHHGDNRTAVYVLQGVFRVEFGDDGTEAIDARAGDFVFVPPGRVHRETNPGDEESRLVVFRAGTGPPTVNVEGPE
jgi:uncharacterized RmlC-like cupin family protein